MPCSLRSRPSARDLAINQSLTNFALFGGLRSSWQLLATERSLGSYGNVYQSPVENIRAHTRSALLDKSASHHDDRISDGTHCNQSGGICCLFPLCLFPTSPCAERLVPGSATGCPEAGSRSAVVSCRECVHLANATSKGSVAYPCSQLLFLPK